MSFIKKKKLGLPYLFFIFAIKYAKHAVDIDFKEWFDQMLKSHHNLLCHSKHLKIVFCAIFYKITMEGDRSFQALKKDTRSIKLSYKSPILFFPPSIPKPCDIFVQETDWNLRHCS